MRNRTACACLIAVAVAVIGCRKADAPAGPDPMASRLRIVPALSATPAPLPSGLAVSLVPAKEGYTLGEPMVVALSVRNAGKQPVAFGRWRGCEHQTHSLVLGVTDPEMREYRDLQPPSHGGCSFMRPVKLAPAEVYAEPLALAEWHPFHLPGRYTVEWTFTLQGAETPWHSVGTVQGRIELAVRPRDPQRLDALCRELAGQVLADEGRRLTEEELETRSRAATLLSYCHDEVAVSYHRGILRKAPRYFSTSIEGLGRIGSPAALETLEEASRQLGGYPGKRAGWVLREVRSGEYRTALPYD